jgi:uncharacterized Zn finger protein (UPF0148 family)
MAKALEDGTIPCPKCGNIMTVETKKRQEDLRASERSSLNACVAIQRL